MGNRDEILHQFLLWRQRFGIHDHQFRLFLLTHMFEKGKTEANQSILMGDDHALDFSRQNRVNQLEKAFALEIETSADFDDPLIDPDLLFLGVSFQGGSLVCQIWSLSRTGNPTIGNGSTSNR